MTTNIDNLIQRNIDNLKEIIKDVSNLCNNNLNYLNENDLNEQFKRLYDATMFAIERSRSRVSIPEKVKNYYNSLS
jgi:hypothetical protein